MTLEESSTYQWILQKGLAEGRKAGLLEGRNAGLLEGRNAGRIGEARATLLRLGGKRFGQAPEGVRIWIEQIESIEHLERLIDAILDVGNWGELQKVA